MEATKMSIEQWMDKEKVAHVHNGIFVQAWEEWNNANCSNIDEPSCNHTKWSKSERKRQILYDTTYRWNLKINTSEPIDKRETESQK